MALIPAYVTPATVDHAGAYPNRKKGDRFEIGYKSKVYVVEVIGEAHEMPNGSIFRDFRFTNVEGPITFAQRFY